MSIVINGGGIIGSLLAFVFSKLNEKNLEIFLIEKNCRNNNKEKTHNFYFPKSIVLSRGSYIFLKKIGLGSILSFYSTKITKIEISEHYGFSKIFLNSQDYELDALGYVIKLNMILDNIFQILNNIANVKIYCPSQLQTIEHRKHTSIVTLNTGSKIFAKLLVAADGLYSPLATFFNIEWYFKKYNQVAIVSEIVTEIPNAGIAFERFVVSGIITVLPIFKNKNFLIWCVSLQVAQEMKTWNKQKFSQELQKAFGWTLGKIIDVNAQYFFNLYLRYTKNHVSHRLALVGNAAQTLHPIAAQGFNLGLRDVIFLSKIVQKALCRNLDIGSDLILNIYQKHRRNDQYKIISITDNLVRLFNNKCFFLEVIRSAGFSFIEHSAILKKFLISLALYYPKD